MQRFCRLISRRWSSSSPFHSDVKSKLYMYEICPWSQKAYASVQYYGLPCDRVEVNPWTKKELSFSEDYKKVPVLTLNGTERVTESDVIMERVRAMKLPDKPVTSHESQWRHWVNKSFIPGLTVNLYGTWSEAFETFNYLTREPFLFSRFDSIRARVSGAVIMKMVAPRLKRKYDIRGDSRDHLYKLVDVWVSEAVGNGKPLGGGSEPDLADLAMWGALQAIRSHRVARDIDSHTGIGDWKQTMSKLMPNSA